MTFGTDFEYIIYIDGACYPTNPGKIGIWGIVITNKGDIIIKCLCGLHKEFKVKSYTSIFMELMALSNCLDYIKKHNYERALVYSDSSYVVNIYNSLYKPHRYKREWAKIFRSKKNLNVSVKWIKGHHSCVGNIMVDNLMRKVYLSLSRSNSDNHPNF